MGLIIDRTIPKFDLSMISRGDLIRIRRAGDTTPRNGIVTRISEGQMEILFANVQNNATSFLQVNAADVAIGVWEIRWSTDLSTINYHPAGDSIGDGGNV